MKSAFSSVAIATLLICSCASQEAVRRAAPHNTPSVTRYPTAVDPTDDCYIGSIEYDYASHPLTVAYSLGRMPSNIAIALMDIGDPRPARYGSKDGSRFKRDDPNWVFKIYTPWKTTLVQQLVGTTAPTVYAEGGKIGCDEEGGGMTWSLEPGTQAFVVSIPPLEGPVPSGWEGIVWTWRVEGDRVLIPQPPTTIGTEFLSQSATDILYNGKHQSGSSISLTALEQYLKSRWHPRAD
jgi:hypothetical protein